MMGEGEGEVKEPDLLQFILNVLNPQAMFLMFHIRRQICISNVNYC